MPTMVREPPAGTRIDLPRFYTGDYQATFARLRTSVMGSQNFHRGLHLEILQQGSLVAAETKHVR